MYSAYGQFTNPRIIENLENTKIPGYIMMTTYVDNNNNPISSSSILDLKLYGDKYSISGYKSTSRPAISGIHNKYNIEIVFNIALDPELIKNSVDNNRGIFKIKLKSNTTFKFDYINNNYHFNNNIKNTIQSEPSTYDYVVLIPAISYDTINHIIKCKLTFTINTLINNGKNGFTIIGLQQAIDSLGKLV
jgi:hypothetical protein